MITPEVMRAIVGDLAVPCEAVTCQAGEPHSAVACVRIQHRCKKVQDNWIFLCRNHHDLLRDGESYCRHCKKNIPYGETVWL